MNGIDVEQILREVPREEVRVNLVVMAVDVGRLRGDLEFRQERVEEQLQLGIKSKNLVMVLWYVLKLRRLMSADERHSETHNRLMELVSEVDHAEPEYLIREIRLLKGDVYPYFGLNAGGLPGYIRSRLDDCLVFLY